MTDDGTMIFQVIPAHSARLRETELSQVRAVTVPVQGAEVSPRHVGQTSKIRRLRGARASCPVPGVVMVSFLVLIWCSARLVPWLPRWASSSRCCELVPCVDLPAWAS